MEGGESIRIIDEIGSSGNKEPLKPLGTSMFPTVFAVKANMKKTGGICFAYQMKIAFFIPKEHREIG